MLAVKYLLLPLLAMRVLYTNTILHHQAQKKVQSYKNSSPGAAGFLHITLKWKEPDMV